MTSIQCAVCGTELTIRVVEETLAQIEPCEECLEASGDDAFEEGLEEGYNEGWDDGWDVGYEGVEDTTQ